MDALVQKIIYLALLVVLAAGIWKTVWSYLKGQKVNDSIKGFIIVCLFLGAAPGLVEVFSHLGETIVKPGEALMNSVVEDVTGDLKKTTDQ